VILVDSSVWVDWFRRTPTPQSEALDDLITRQIVVVGDLILAEVLQGVMKSDALERTRAVLLSLKLVSIGSVGVALQAAANYRHLRRLGFTPRSMIDTLIATRCIAEGWPLLASDRDYQPFAEHLGLELVA